MASLKYMPLSKPQDFRLINISAGSFNEPLRLEMYNSTLSDDEIPSYEALSYVWGSIENPVMVHVLVRPDNEAVTAIEIPIGKNLATALRHLRSHTMPRTIWADAICINQTNLPERTHQVLLMAKIYRLARKVVAFLGPEGNDSSHAMNLIKDLDDLIEVDFSTGLVKEGPGSNRSAWVDMLQPSPFERRDLDSVYHLLHRDWFERLWIRQEIGLGGQNGVLQCGSKLVSWPNFCNAIFVFHRKPIAEPSLEFRQIRAFQDRLGKVDNISLMAMRSFEFINLREQLGHSKCLDPRDRIYGILSQLKWPDQVEIIPDYAKSVVDVYTDLAQRHIKYCSRLDIISQCELDDMSTLPLPSWVPDWSRSRKAEGIHELAPELFHVLSTFAYVDQRLLQAYGLYVSRVNLTFPFNRRDLHSENDNDTVLELRRLLLELEKDETVRATYQTRTSFVEACCRNLWLNNFSQRWMPQVPHETNWADCVAAISTILDPLSVDLALSSQNNITRYLGRCRESCTARTLFVTEDGHIGIAAESVAPKDEVCFLFGCHRPMVLRPITPTASSPTTSSESNYRVVSECHVDGAMYGEFVLGDLPPKFRGILNLDSEDLWPPAFMDFETDIILQTDPRTEPFLQRLKERGLLVEPTLEELKRVGAMDTLIKAGVPIRIFDLM